MRKYASAIPLLLLSACASIPAQDDPSSQAVSYKALGTEPFWSLTIDQGEMRLETPDAPAIRSGPFTARPSFNGWRYVSDRMTVDVTFARCSDGMSDRVYKDKVAIEIGEKTYNGCGGAVLPPEKLDGTSWIIESLGGEAIAADRQALVRFADGRISASLGCNRLMAEYRYADGKLSAGPVASTRMTCPSPVAQQEAKLSALLGSLSDTSFAFDGRMTFTGTGGEQAILRQSI